MTQNLSQSEMIALHAFNNEEDSMLDAMNGISSENEFEYLQKCVNSLESRDSGVNLSPDSVSVSGSELNVEILEDDYERIINDSHDVNIRFMKGKNVFLDSKINDEDDLRTIELESNIENDSRSSPSIHEQSDGILEYVVTPEDDMDYHLLDTSPMADHFDNFENRKFLMAIEESLEKSFQQEDFSIIPSTSDESFSDNRNDNNDNLESEETETVENDLQSDKVEVENIGSKEESPNSDPYICSQCPMTFKYKRHFDRHMEGHEKNNCFNCDAKFARRKHLDVHLFRVHGEKSDNGMSVSCETCSHMFSKKILLNRHKAKEHLEGGKVCIDCGEIINVNAQVAEHEMRHEKEKIFECEKCSQSFSKKQTYQSHIQNHDNYKCFKCEASFASKKVASKHFRLVHPTKAQSIKPMKDGLYYCFDCHQGFVKKSGYCRHLETAMHLNKINQISATFSCPVCQKILTTRQACVQHIRRVHRGDKKFICDMQGCSFQCAYKNDLDRHKQLHVEERNVVCEYCGKQFTSISILKDHILYVHNRERHFVCEECGKSFKRNSLLNRHKLSHQQIRPFACSQCAAAFKRSHHLTRHMESCHRLTLQKKRKVVKLMRTEDGDLIPVPEPFKQESIKKTKIQKNVSSNTKIQRIPDVKNQTSLIRDSIDDQLSIQTDNSNPFSLVSLVDINSGLIDDIVSQFEESCNEMLDLSSYHDLEFQSEILNYSGFQLEDEGENSLLLDCNK